MSDTWMKLSEKCCCMYYNRPKWLVRRHWIGLSLLAVHACTYFTNIKYLVTSFCIYAHFLSSECCPAYSLTVVRSRPHIRLCLLLSVFDVRMEGLSISITFAMSRWRRTNPCAPPVRTHRMLNCLLCGRHTRIGWMRRFHTDKFVSC